MKVTYLSRFTPSLMTPEALENIFVQRHKLAQQLVELIHESTTTPSKHYTLLIGPRGIGKTHFISLVYHRIRKMDDLQNRLLIAWLREDEWGVTSFLDLLLRIFRALHKEYEDAQLVERVESLYELPAEDAERVAAALLKEVIGNRTLLLLMENLDEVFAGLDDEGQKQLRAYLQENAFCTIVATAQSLFNGVKLQTSPFYGFFRVRYLKALTLDEAVQLLTNVAKLEGDRDLESFIQTPIGRDRIQAVHYLSGGSPRVYIIFSAFLTRKSLDELVEAFMAMLDDLTPYYQERMKCLSPQQCKIVDVLCDRRQAVTVKEIAQRCFITHQTASSQLKKLLEMRYVSSEPVGRESYYEIREPLMRFCLEVKKQRGEPIRLFVDFLRLWYTQTELERRLEMLSVDAVLERQYVLLALQEIKKNCQNSRVAVDREEYNTYVKKGNADYSIGEYQKAIEYYNISLTIAKKIGDYQSEAYSLSNLGNVYQSLGKYQQAIGLYEQSLEIVQKINYHQGEAYSLSNLGNVYHSLGQYQQAIALYQQSLRMVREIEDRQGQAYSLGNLGNAYHSLGQYRLAIDYYQQSLAIAREIGDCRGESTCVMNLGNAYQLLGQYRLAIDYYQRSLAIAREIGDRPGESTCVMNLGNAYQLLGQYRLAIDYYQQSLAIAREIGDRRGESTCVMNLGNAYQLLGQYRLAIDYYQQSLAIAREIGDRRGGSTCVMNLGNAYQLLGQYRLAIDYYQQSLAIAQEMADCSGEVNSLSNLCSVYYSIGQSWEAIQCWDRSIAALDNALNRFAHRDKPDNGDTKAIIRNLFNSTHDAAIWRSRITILVELYKKHKVLPSLGKGLVESIPALMSEMVSDKSARAWLEVWQELTSDCKEFQIPLRLLNAAVSYRQTKSDPRVLLKLPTEERNLLKQVLKIDEQ